MNIRRFQLVEVLVLQDGKNLPFAQNIRDKRQKKAGNIYFVPCARLLAF